MAKGQAVPFMFHQACSDLTQGFKGLGELMRQVVAVEGSGAGTGIDQRLRKNHGAATLGRRQGLQGAPRVQPLKPMSKCLAARSTVTKTARARRKRRVAESSRHVFASALRGAHAGSRQEPSEATEEGAAHDAKALSAAPRLCILLLAPLTGEFHLHLRGAPIFVRHS